MNAKTAVTKRLSKNDLKRIKFQTMLMVHPSQRGNDSVHECLRQCIDNCFTLLAEIENMQAGVNRLAGQIEDKK